jgi:hypothetical protein
MLNPTLKKNNGGDSWLAVPYNPQQLTPRHTKSRRIAISRP